MDNLQTIYLMCLLNKIVLYNIYFKSNILESEFIVANTHYIMIMFGMYR